VAFIVILAGIFVLALSVGADAEAPVYVSPSPVEFSLNDHFTPSALSKVVRTPIALKITGQVRTADGTHPPALRELILDADKNLAFDVNGFPACRPTFVQNGLYPFANCGKAIVGKGSADFEIAFPEATPIPISSEFTIYNAGLRAGVVTLYARGYVTVPTPAMILVTIKIRDIHKGRFGTEAVATVPKIAGGSGSLTSFSATIDKKLTYRGRRASALTMKCPDGRIRTHSEAIFSDGTMLAGDVVRPCKPKD
jgi:hypothetical protein